MLGGGEGGGKEGGLMPLPSALTRVTITTATTVATAAAPATPRATARRDMEMTVVASSPTGTLTERYTAF